MDFQEMVQFRNTHNPYAQNLGIHVEEIRQGYARTTKTVTEEDTNIAGMAHGGLFFSMADTTSGSALSSYGRRAVTLNASLNFLRGAKPGDTLTGEAREVKHGETICVYDVTIRNQEGTPVSAGTFSFFLLNEPLNG